MRAYLPVTLPILATVLDTGLAAASGDRVVAVTEALRSAVGGDDEQQEYAAQTLAADRSVQLLRADPSAPRRRVVLALDVDAADPVPTDDGATLSLAADVPLRRVAAALVDDPAAARDVAAATSASEAEPEGLAAALDRLDDHELLWFAAQELAELVRGADER